MSESSWFTSQVLVYKSVEACFWTCVLLSPLALFTSILHDLQFSDLWALCGLSLWLWSKVIGCLVLIYGLVFLQSSLFYRNFHVERVIDLTRVNSLRRALSLRCVTALLSPPLVGGASVYCLLSVTYNHDDHMNTENSVLSGGTTFLVLHGCFVGLIHSVKTYWRDEYLLRFPRVWQIKQQVVRAQLIKLFTDAHVSVLTTVLLYYILYILFTFVQSLMWPEASNQNRGVDVFSVTLLWATCLTGGFVLSLFRLSLFLGSLFLTEPCQFDIESDVNDKMCLYNALSTRSHLNLQYHAAQDLYRLSLYSSARRAWFFSLTRFGGHPVNWTRLLNVCMEDLTRLMTDLVWYNDHSTVTPVNNQIQYGAGIQLPASHVTSRPGLPVADIRQRAVVGGVSQPVAITQPPIQITWRLQLEDKTRQLIRSLRVVRYMTDVSPEAVSLQIFSHSQKQIWIIEALTQLVCWSSIEDEFGVVQKSLAEIITTLVSLYQEVDKHIKLCPVSVRKPVLWSNGYSSPYTHVFSLRSTLRESLYSIVNTFKHHLTSLNISEDVCRRLVTFNDFKE